MKKLIQLFTLLVLVNIAVAQSIPDWTKTDTKGNSYTLHDLLSGGNAVILDFMATWCSPCQSSTPALQSMWLDYGSGSGGVYVFAMDVDDAETDAELDAFAVSYGGGYPGITSCSSIYSFYNSLHGTSQIPFFIILIPNTSDPAASTIEFHQVGWSGAVGTSMRNTLNSNGYYIVGTDYKITSNNISLYPNPASTSTDITIEMPTAGDINVEIYNIVGEKVATPFKGVVNVGTKKVINLNTSNFSPGFYFAKIQVGDQVQTLKLNVVN